MRDSPIDSLNKKGMNIGTPAHEKLLCIWGMAFELYLYSPLFGGEHRDIIIPFPLEIGDRTYVPL